MKKLQAILKKHKWGITMTTVIWLLGYATVHLSSTMLELRLYQLEEMRRTVACEQALELQDIKKELNKLLPSNK